MTTVKLNVKKTHRANYGRFSKNTNMNEFEATYGYYSALDFNYLAGVQAKAPGTVIKQLRQQKDMSRRAFAEHCNKVCEAKGLPIKVNDFNIASYESWYKDPHGDGMRHPCCPKIDKLRCIAHGYADLAGMSVEDAFVTVMGYTLVVGRKGKLRIGA